MKFQRIHQPESKRPLIAAAVWLALACFLQAVHGKLQQLRSEHHRITFLLAD